VPHLGKFYRLATREERGRQDRRPRDHRARQQAAVRPIEYSNTLGSQYLRTLDATRVCCRSQTLEARKVSEFGFYLHAVYTPCQVGSQILVLRLPQLLHAPTQNSKDLAKSTSSCDSLCQRSHWGTQRAIVLYLCCVSHLKSQRDTSTLVLKQSSTHCSNTIRRPSDTGDRP